MNHYMGETWQTWWLPKVSQTAVRNKKGLYSEENIALQHLTPFQTPLAGASAWDTRWHVHSWTYITHTYNRAQSHFSSRTHAAHEQLMSGCLQVGSARSLGCYFSPPSLPNVTHVRTHPDFCATACRFCRRPDWQLPSKSTFPIVVFPFLLVFPQAPSLTSNSFLHVIYFYFISQRCGEELRSRVEH